MGLMCRSIDWQDMAEPTGRIRVEFYGIPRRRAGVAQTCVQVSGVPSLGSVLEQLAAQYPLLQRDCISDRRLRPGYSASIDGKQFVADPDTRLPQDTSLLIMSSDAGG